MLLVKFNYIHMYINKNKSKHFFRRNILSNKTVNYMARKGMQFVDFLLFRLNYDYTFRSQRQYLNISNNRRRQIY